MNRGAARRATFFGDRDRREFGRLLGVGCDRFDVEVGAFCLMPNHYHLLLHCPAGGLSALMQLLGSVFTRHTNDRVGRDGPLFRGRFHSIEVTTYRYLVNAARYIHRNPIEIGVERLEHYPWSSHGVYLGLRPPLAWLKVDPVLDVFGGDATAFHEFVTGERLGRRGPVSVERLTQCLKLAVDEIDEPLGRAPQGLVRTVGLLALDALDGDDADRFAATFAFPNARAQRQALLRARRQSDGNPVLAAAARRALDLAA